MNLNDESSCRTTDTTYFTTYLAYSMCVFIQMMKLNLIMEAYNTIYSAYIVFTIVHMTYTAKLI